MCYNNRVATAVGAKCGGDAFPFDFYLANDLSGVRASCSQFGVDTTAYAICCNNLTVAE